MRPGGCWCYWCQNCFPDSGLGDPIVPQLGDLWYFTGPILGIGYIREVGGGQLVVSFRSGGQHALDKCWPSELVWRCE